MKQKKMTNFQVIGAYNRMQTIPWEEENRLFDGVPYDIDLSQDSPDLYLNGIPIKDIPTKNMVKFINFKKSVETCDRNRYDPMGEDYFVVEFSKLGEMERHWRKEKKETERRKQELWNEYLSFYGVGR